MSRLALMVRTVWRLGLRNVARVVLYKLRLKLGWRLRPLQIGYPGGMIFDWRLAGLADEKVPGPATLSVFGWHKIICAAPPDWHSDPFGCAPRLNPSQDCFQALTAIGDVDVKPYWELSRFYWLPQFALDARNGDRDAALRAEHWLRSWVSNNPQFRGVNWACGQEAAIRLMNLALSALILDTWHSPSPAMKWLIETHARRIEPTLSYALGQDNNHGTAEACALFIAGTWGKVWAMPGAERIAQTGRKWLNDRALRMIQPDGSPCQYSTTYHRANLEAFCIAELWAARIGCKGLEADAVLRVLEGARWLHAITDPATGDAPNTGANDGSHLFSIPPINYRDFRPTVAMAAALFDSSRPWPDYEDPRLAALNIAVGLQIWPTAVSKISDDGGFFVLRKGKALVLMRYPRFQFRPSQSDLLHIDLWIDGKNLLRDAGTYSYNNDAHSVAYFGGVAGHNTVQFDGRDQMTRLGRFLWGDWLRTRDLESPIVRPDGMRAGAGYRDGFGAEHHRQVYLHAMGVRVTDRVSGFGRSAVLRWRLAPGNWVLCASSSTAALGFCKFENGQGHSLTVHADVAFMRCELVQGWESLYYLEKTPVPVLELEVDQPCTWVTHYDWTP